MSTGWLAADESTANTIGRAVIDRSKFPTRYEEYMWVLSQLAKVRVGSVVDAGAGFNVEIHVLDYALGDLGWNVTAVDSNYESLQMPIHPKIVRWIGDIRHLWWHQGGAYDAWICVSTLEHIDKLEDQIRTVEAGYGVLKSGGVALITADNTSPTRLSAMLRYAGFETDGAVPAPTNMLTPAVSWAIGRKP